MKPNIVLIGMPGVGKSTSGVILAKVMGYEFIDSDLLIQKREHKKLAQIIEERGVEGFWQVENEVNSAIEVEGAVIATGGSAIYGKEAMEHLHEIGTVVYLHASYRTLERRLRNLKSRGVTLREGQTLKDLYEERVPLYQKYADFVVEQDHLDIEGTVKNVLEQLEFVD